MLKKNLDHLFFLITFQARCASAQLWNAHPHIHRRSSAAIMVMLLKFQVSSFIFPFFQPLRAIRDKRKKEK
jgi:hypothetical protein